MKRKRLKGTPTLREELTNALCAYNVGKTKSKQIELHDSPIKNGVVVVHVRFKGRKRVKGSKGQEVKREIIKRLRKEKQESEIKASKDDGA